jgi:hypothetical protein
MNKATLTDLLLYEAAEADFNLKLAKLREFYEAVVVSWSATGRIVVDHTPKCRLRLHGAPCDCDAWERQARIDKALAALAEEDDASEATA